MEAGEDSGAVMIQQGKATSEVSGERDLWGISSVLAERSTRQQGISSVLAERSTRQQEPPALLRQSTRML